MLMRSPGASGRNQETGRVAGSRARDSQNSSLPAPATSVGACANAAWRSRRCSKARSKPSSTMLPALANPMPTSDRPARRGGARERGGFAGDWLACETAPRSVVRDQVYRRTAAASSPAARPASHFPGSAARRRPGAVPEKGEIERHKRREYGGEEIERGPATGPGQKLGNSGRRQRRGSLQAAPLRRGRAVGA